MWKKLLVAALFISMVSGLTVSTSFAKNGDQPREPQKLVYEGLLWWMHDMDNYPWIDDMLTKFMNFLFGGELDDFYDEGDPEIIDLDEWSDVG